MIFVDHKDCEIFFHGSKNAIEKIEDTLTKHNVSVSSMLITGNTYILIVPDTVSKELNHVLSAFKRGFRFSDEYKAWKKSKIEFRIERYPVKSYIKGPTELLPKDTLRTKLGYFVKAAVNTKSYKTGRWDGIISLYDGRKKSFLTGISDIAESIIKKAGFSVVVEDKYERFPPKKHEWTAKHLFDLDEDQVEAIDACMKAGRCICKAPTGYGKTAVLARYLTVGHGVDTLFIANKKQLLDDASADFCEGIEEISETDIGQIKDGKFCNSDLKHGIIKPITQPIVVATIQSLAARLNDPNTRDVLSDWLANTCQFVMVDETQAVGTKQWDDVLGACNAPYRVFLSATPKRTDGASIKIQAYSGPLAYTTTAEEQIEKGRLCELDIRFRVFDHKLYNYDDSIDYSSAYEEFIQNNRDRNIEAIVKPTLSMINEGRFVLVLIQRIDHGIILKDLFIEAGVKPADIRFVFGESAESARKMAIREFRKGKFKILIGSTIFDAGVNIPLISGVVLAGAGNSEITLIQRIGRGARNCDYEEVLGYLPDFMKEKSEKTTIVYDVLDAHSKFFTKQAKNRYQTARDEFGVSRVTIENGSEEDFKMKKFAKTFKVDDSMLAQIEEANKKLAEYFQ